MERRGTTVGTWACDLPPPRGSWPHLLQCVLVQLMQVERVDALLGSHHQELICQCSHGVRGHSWPQPKPRDGRLPLLHPSLPRVTGWTQVTAA